MSNYQIEKDMLSVTRGWGDWHSASIESVIRQRLTRKFYNHLQDSQVNCLSANQKNIQTYRQLDSKQECLDFLKKFKLEPLSKWEKNVQVDSLGQVSCVYMQSHDITDKFPRCEPLDEVGLDYKIVLELDYTDRNYKLPESCKVTSTSHNSIVCTLPS